MNTFDSRYLKALAVPLPEDVAARKAAGDFEGLERLIGVWLSRDIPEALRRKLILEREIAKRLPLDYPYTREQAMEKARAFFPDMTEEEFLDLRDRGRIDWIYVDREERYFDRLTEVLLDDPGMNRRSAYLLGKIPTPDSEVPLSEDTAAKRGSIERIRRMGYDLWHFQVTHTLEVKEACFVPGTYRVWIPIPGENAFTKNLDLLSMSEGGSPAPKDALQRTVYFEKHLEAPEPFQVTYAYDSVVTWCDLWTKTAEEQAMLHRLEKGDVRPEDTAEQLPHIRFDAYMRSLAGQIAGEEKNPLIQARKVFDFITTKVKYSYVRSYFTIEDLSGYAGIGLKGDCGIQALLFITLCRILGIPARWQSGHSVRLHTSGSHDWANVYIAPFGWRYVDLSAGGDAFAAGDEQRRRFYFGNMDCFRMAANRRFQADFDPPCTSLRSDPYDNQDGEVEFEGVRCLLIDEEVSVQKSVTAQHRD